MARRRPLSWSMRFDLEPNPAQRCGRHARRHRSPSQSLPILFSGGHGLGRTRWVTRQDAGHGLRPYPSGPSSRDIGDRRVTDRGRLRNQPQTHTASGQLPDAARCWRSVYGDGLRLHALRASSIPARSIAGLSTSQAARAFRAADVVAATVEVPGDGAMRDLSNSATRTGQSTSVDRSGIDAASLGMPSHSIDAAVIGPIAWDRLSRRAPCK